MIIMALDHVRDFFHSGAYVYNPTDLRHASAAVFFTRWITHFCAPVFVFLAGTAARLQGERKTKQQLSMFLFTRGLWLIFLEMAVVTLGWTFNISYHVIILQVIWAIGFAMLVLAAAVYLPPGLTLGIGLLLIAGHNMLDHIDVSDPGFAAALWGILHKFSSFHLGPVLVIEGYPVIPWTGIMLTGYGLGFLYLRGTSTQRRKSLMLQLGILAILLFIVLRVINGYGDPRPWSPQHSNLFSLLSFINTSKYPPSLDYCLMTLGPALLFLSISERWSNWLCRQISVFGRVPLFYYLSHVYLVHLLAVFAAAWSGYSWRDMIFSSWVTDNPSLRGYGFPLWVVYSVWILVIVALFPLCKKYDAYKRRNRSKKWLSYL